MSLQTQSAPLPPAPQAPARPNAVLSRLPKDAEQRLLVHCTRVSLPRHELLLEAGNTAKWAYFPCSGLVSLQMMTEDAASLEIALIGREGVVGLNATPATESVCTAVVVVPGEALRIRADTLQTESERNPALQRVLLVYANTLITEMAYGAACHRFHTARQRLARWLLTVSDRTQSPHIEMTQVRLGQALGLQRTGATAASIALQDAGAIKARHGRITILDRRRLEGISCECFRRELQG